MSGVQLSVCDPLGQCLRLERLSDVRTSSGPFVFPSNVRDEATLCAQVRDEDVGMSLSINPGLSIHCSDFIKTLIYLLQFHKSF